MYHPITALVGCTSKHFTPFPSSTLPIHQEEIADLEKRSQRRDSREWGLVILSRALANAFVFLILFGAAICIFQAAQFGLDNVCHTL